MDPKDRIIVALDVPTPAEAFVLVEELKEHVGGFKLGLELLNSSYLKLLTTPGYEAAEYHATLQALIKATRGKLFADLKLNDIPNTVAAVAKAWQAVSPMFINVHASAGMEAMRAVVANKGSSKVLAVTVLTSLSESDCLDIFGETPDLIVSEFAAEAERAGADGIICSPRDLVSLRELSDVELPSGFLKVTPGVRPEWAAMNDQVRVMTPSEAIKAGATHLVIGRPITKPPPEIGSPVEAVKRILDEIADVS